MPIPKNEEMHFLHWYAFLIRHPFSKKGLWKLLLGAKVRSDAFVISRVGLIWKSSWISVHFRWWFSSLDELGNNLPIADNGFVHLPFTFMSQSKNYLFVRACDVKCLLWKYKEPAVFFIVLTKLVVTPKVFRR